MATESFALVPFHDPFDEMPSLDPSAFFAESPTLGRSELPSNNHYDSLNYVGHQSGHDPVELLDSDDPLSDPVIWAFCNDVDGDLAENSQSGPSQFPGECSSHGLDQICNDPVPGDINPMDISVFSTPNSQQNCICCQKLREITHSNGLNMKRLEIHGRFGVITHAILEKFNFDSSSASPEFQMFDFHKESMECVKQFLVNYIDMCKQEGFVMLQDPLSTFYEALCVGLNDDNFLDEFLQSSPENIGDCPNNPQEMAYHGDIKIPLAVQRARTGNLKLKDFIDYFDLPIEEAARKMNICPTVMKKICRRNGVSRWPYRKIRSIKRKLSRKTEIVKASNNEEKARAMEDIEKCQRELADIYAAFVQK